MPLDYAELPRFSEGSLTTQVTFVIDLGPWTRCAQERVCELAVLQDGWDGHNSPAVTAAAKERALSAIDFLTKFKMPKPHIVPLSGGGLQFEWSNSVNELEIEIAADGSLGYLAMDSAKEIQAGELADQYGLVEIAPILTWFNRKKETLRDWASYA